MEYLYSKEKLGEVTPNIASMLVGNYKEYKSNVAFAEKHNGAYIETSWSQLVHNICNVAENILKLGFKPGDKMIIFSQNRQEMLELELAIMAIGGISVPIFGFFHQETAELLIVHSDAKYLAVSGELQLSRVSSKIIENATFTFDVIKNNYDHNVIPFSSLREGSNNLSVLDTKIDPESICLNMYTSGTMGIPKCVQLTHKNILSQQAGLKNILNVNTEDRFLSYLPWHHSFGGIFERFTSLYNGATMYLESGFGKNVDELLVNWKEIKPTVFFSVPKIYQLLVEQSLKSKKNNGGIFESSLKFVFTAAASLPTKLGAEFEKRNIPVLEGWGLTETSPCCTITNPHLPRQSGVVGMPIPGVTIRIADDGEIQVDGPNVMKGYYKNDIANETAFSDDNWFCTGDIGEITPNGLKLISRKDRIFKLTNGEKVIPSEMEEIIQTKCHYLTYAVVVGGGKEYPIALLFPNKKAIQQPNYEIAPAEGCFCPRSINELGNCLRGCLQDANCGVKQKFSKIRFAIIIDDELSIENNTLTPSLKIAPNKILEAYKGKIEEVYDGNTKTTEDVYIINLEKEDIANPLQ